jgi:alpha/beta superfamily hydrolase
MKTEQFFVLNQNGNKLAAKLDKPDSGNIIAFALFSHCFTCSMELKSIININKSLSDIGIAVFRFDMTGVGSSEGHFPDTNFTSQLDDLQSVINYISLNYEPVKLLIGHSLGGSISLFKAIETDSIKAVATIASPAEPRFLADKLNNTKLRAEIEGIADTEIGGVKFEFKPQFFDDINSYSLLVKLKYLNKPYLILHSNIDTYSSIENARMLFQASSEPKSFISLDNIDHLMLKKEDALYVGRLIGTWAGKYL